MKRLLAAGLLFAATTAAAQLGAPRGVPASATSITPRNPTPGVPASVTSIAPPAGGRRFFAPGVSAGFSFGAGHFTGHIGFRHHRRPLIVPVFYPVYPYYYPAYAQPEPEPDPALREEPAADLPSGNALERELWSRAAARGDGALEPAGGAAYLAQDARYGEHYLDAREQRGAARAGAEPADAAAPAPPPPAETQLILILRDGTQLELANYAIVGQTVFDLGYGDLGYGDSARGDRGRGDSASNGAPRRRKKIPLAELDLPATQKANDDRGFEFHPPAAP